jgi:NAD-dependent dihydropyrimidine dehydrogenase PreA subunit
MQLTERVPNCNGCSACVVGCYNRSIEMRVDEKTGNKYPYVRENGCNKCNNCILYCPLFNPVELPTFDKYYEYDRKYYERDLPKIYRETMRKAKNGEHVEFIGPLCQIAALKSVMGDKMPPNVIVVPLACDMDNPDRPECSECIFWK